ncbi:hypothetical protein ED312_20205 [Sinomicrobium pectinilyticum]|uniref:Lipoprotein n=1 Tax=Sinomicrobium pectinilyticum TaxID=1084421 RepID=A0A3N0DQQ8_SINP1|nr:hypothetical protein [Sinomicrobium pectinilyticum]RNL77970.1 hypothetical protein ED312_20205 [Sinomicrobium pectinilyticum]
MRNVLFLKCLSGIICCTIFFSCQDDDLVKKEQVSTSSITLMEFQKEDKLKEAENWYASYTIKNERLQAKGSTQSDTPDWEEAKLFSLTPSLSDLVRVPIPGFEVNVSYLPNMNPHGFRDLLLRKIDSMEYLINFIEIHPDSTYFDKLNIDYSDSRKMRNTISDSDFTGYFLVYNKDRQLIYGERREKGITVSKLANK